MSAPRVAATVGERTGVFDPAPNYLNDHTLVRGDDGTWHLFGITAPEPARPLEEVHFLHATAPDLHGPWTEHEPVMPADESRGETHVWAPHVISHDGRWWMFFTGGTPDHTRYRIELASSEDLWTWKREGTLFEDGFDARDPMVARVGEGFVLYYTRTSTPEGGNHQVAARTGQDLRTWSEPTVVFESPDEGTVGGPTESPFVWQDTSGPEPVWFLSVCDAWAYDVTRVYASTDPMRWEPDQLCFEVAEHCPEYVVDEDQHLWVTGAGWGRGGLYLRRLEISVGDAQG